MYKDYAEEYFKLGLKPTCISYIKTKYNINETNPEKSPCHSWRRWQIRTPELTEIQNLPWGVSNGIGTVLGYTNRCIDIDNCNDISVLHEFLKELRLPEDYEWAVKTPNGFHIHIISAPLPFVTDKELQEGVLALLPNDSSKNKFKRIEMRWAHHAVLPPTVINGIPYEFVFLREDAIPSNEPQGLNANTLFCFLVKYCGYNNENLVINNINFKLTELSGGSKSISAHKVSNFSLDYENNIDNSEFIGYFDSNGYHHPPIFIDIETTGLIQDQTDYNKYPRIIQIAASLDWRDRKIIINNYIKPNGFSVPIEIEQLTGITNSFLIEFGIPIHEALLSFSEVEMSNPIICYNADFDISILDSEFIRLKNNFSYIRNTLRDGSQIFCLMKKINTVFGGKYLKLTDAYELLFKDNIPVKAHNAVNDLEILMDCFNIMELYGYIKWKNKGRTLV